MLDKTTDTPSPDDRRRLDAALNEITAYAAKHLADQWEFHVWVTGGRDGRGDVWMELLDPEGEYASEDWPSEQRNIWAMVEHSQNPEANS
jgi:hypothetical protein